VLGNVERYVELVAVVGPRDEDKVAGLLVERKMTNVESAVGVDDGREHPEHLAV